MKTVMMVIALVVAVGCKKKDESAPAPAGDTKGSAQTPETPKPEAPPPEAPKPEATPDAAAAVEFAIPGEISECDALVVTYKRFQGCAKIKDKDRAVHDRKVSSFPDLVKVAGSKLSVGIMCRNEDDELKKLLTAAGC